MGDSLLEAIAKMVFLSSSREGFQAIEKGDAPMYRKRGPGPLVGAEPPLGRRFYIFPAYTHLQQQKVIFTV